MTYIKLQTDGKQISVDMEGESKDLVGMIASLFIKDEQFSMLIISALAVVSEHGNPINDINPN
jgi:hypothetical protein